MASNMKVGTNKVAQVWQLQVWQWLLAVGLMAAGALAVAAPASTAEGPHAVVEQTTEELLTVVRENRALLESDPEAYYRKVKGVLEPVVDFEYIARGVMGPHWKTASQAQRQQFIKTFRDSLVETYAKGMANYADLQPTVVPPDEPATSGRVGVVQEIAGPDGTNRVAYTMARNSNTGEWKLINMVLNGVNLGKTFRNQFAQAVKQHEANLDAVIKNWSADV